MFPFQFTFWVLPKITVKYLKDKGLIEKCKEVYVDGKQGSEVSTLTKAWTTEELCFDSLQGKDFSLLWSVHPGSGVHLGLYSMANGDLEPGLQWPRHGTDHSSASSAKVKNEWSYTSTRPCIFIVCIGTTLPLASTDENLKAYFPPSLYLYFVTFLPSMLVFQFLNCFYMAEINIFCCNLYCDTVYLLPLA